jgi:hypothetical protein
MKLKHLSAIIVLLITVIAFGSCSYKNDMTKVTIYFGKNTQSNLQQQKLPLIDRILNLFSSPAYAQTIHQPGDSAFYYLYVTADDIEGKSSVVPGTESTISIDVPSGNNRVFTLLSFSPNGIYNYIGQEVTDLTGGDANVTIIMYPCLNNIQVQYTDYLDITWNYDMTLDGDFSTVSIYRACYGTDTTNCDGSITSLSTEWPIGSSGSGIYTDSSISFGPINEYIYLLTVNTGSYGGGGISIPANFLDFQENTNNAYLIGYIMGIYVFNITKDSF